MAAMAASLAKTAVFRGFRPFLVNKSLKWYFHSSSNLLGTKGVEVKMPALSPTMTEGTIIGWLKKEGDSISPGDVLCEVQTDKAVVSLELEEEGILAKILVPSETKDIKIGTLIALMVEPGEDWKDVEIPTASPVGEAPTAALMAPSSTSVPTPTTQTSQGDHKPGKMGPAVRTILQQYGLSANDVQPTATGPHHALLKGDVLSYIESHKLTPKTMEEMAVGGSTLSKTISSASAVAAPEQDYVDIPLTNMRKVIAKRLTQSKTTIPHAYMNINSDVAKVVELRLKMKEEGIAVSVNDFIIKAVAVALQHVPALNVNMNGEQLQPLSTVDISIAVATDTGLITPIIKSADRLSVSDISKNVKELAVKARKGKLQPHEFQGGSFSVSNLGMFGVTEFSAVINPPQAAILAVGASRPVATAAGRGLHMTTTLSYDARAISEKSSADFLEIFKALIENPQLLEADGVRSRASN